MPVVDRRRFLQLAGGASALSLLPQTIARAAEIPAYRGSGTLRDVEHIVVLMQENRAFDHYFGTLRGVRGFGDPHPAVLPSGKPVWYQSDGARDVLPFRPDVADLGLAFIQDLDHGWDGTHRAFNSGAYDTWVPAKTATTMAHLERRDIPFHYALADAFTVCDGYHCSLLGPTDPNRYYMWTGWIGNDGKGGGPVNSNAEAGYRWTTYPERLEAAGVSWRIYQDEGIGLDAAGAWGYTDDAYIGNYGDNSLLYFDNYRGAAPGSPLYDKARTGTRAATGQGLFDLLRRDVQTGTLPQISWITAPEAFTEHPNWPANFGAWYVAQVIDALTSNPDVWSRTALLITYDENDGFFDHVVPAYPNVGRLPGGSTVPTALEEYVGPGQHANIGLGPRVPMLVVSPWSTGGFVCSETFDHTSIIRLMEKRFGVPEPQITPWRRAVCGDLTSAFDFGRAAPAAAPALPPTAAYRPKDHARHPDYVPVPPADPRLPAQERGTRPARPIDYRLDADATVSQGTLRVRFGNAGGLGAVFQARSRTIAGGPFTYTVGAGQTFEARWPVAGAHDLSVHGPDGFYRRFAADRPEVPLTVTASRPVGRLMILEVGNTGATPVTVRVHDAYAGDRTLVVVGRGRLPVPVDAGRTGGWYDVTLSAGALTWQYAGRLQDGRPGTSDPQIGR